MQSGDLAVAFGWNLSNSGTVVAIAVGLWASAIASVTLYVNYLKSAKLSLKIGKSAIIVLHNKALGGCPVVEVFCTVINEGARAGIVESLTAKLLCSSVSGRFNSYAYLKLNNNEQWALEEYAHPLVVPKYSETSKMVMFKSEELTFPFREGSYRLTIEALVAEERVGIETIGFVVDVALADKIQRDKDSEANVGTEIPLV